ncbi:MAG: hypothetical protein A2V88_05925 [Elusimicrobia bacterium RBG_16_66_12]|nr:MAG: hypothetical protein A2V88_05925 [Elusimicrobia bacterium RBG_16_66_12]
MLVSVAIVIVRPLEPKVTRRYHPLLLVSTVEFLMCIVEVVLAVLVSRGFDHYCAFAVFFLLAVIYNFSVPSKRFVIYKYFFPEEERQHLSILQGALEQIITIPALFLVGVILQYSGFATIALIDAASFFIFGSYLLIQYGKYKHLRLEEPQNTDVRPIPSMHVFLLILAFTLVMPLLALVNRLGNAITWSVTGGSILRSTFVFAAAYSAGILTAVLTRANPLWSPKREQSGYEILIVLGAIVALVSAGAFPFTKLPLLVLIYLFGILNSIHMHYVREVSSFLSRYNIRVTDFIIRMNFTARWSLLIFIPLCSWLIDLKQPRTVLLVFTALLTTAYILLHKKKNEVFRHED